MKNKIKYFFMFSILFVMGIISINLFQPNKDQQIKGNIEIWANEESYDYLLECANNFMKINDKTFINIKKIENYNQVTDYFEDNIKAQNPKIVQINRVKFEELDLQNYKYYQNVEKLLDNYASNFSQYRIEQLKIDDKFIGIPLNSRPLALYMREDMLKEYGYERGDINTWNDIIKIGNDIYNKSNGKMSIINATGQDYEDLLSLLIMENSIENKNEDMVKSDVQNMIKNLKDNHILNFENDGEFLGRISSINAIKEISELDEKCEWSAGNVPSIKPGVNKFFAAEGDNLVVINNNVDNQKLIEKFITYIIANNNETLKYVKQGDFFSSYLNTYSTAEIQDDIKNFVGKSPLLVLTNIEEKTPEIKDYEKYIKIKRELKVH